MPIPLALARLPWLWSGCLGLGQVALALVMLPGLWSGCLSFGQVQIVLALARLPWLWSGCFGFVQVVLALVRKSQKETEEFIFVLVIVADRVSGQYSFYMDPDPAKNLNMDPDPAFI